MVLMDQKELLQHGECLCIFSCHGDIDTIHPIPMPEIHGVKPFPTPTKLNFSRNIYIYIYTCLFPFLFFSKHCGRREARKGKGIGARYVTKTSRVTLVERA